jgi:hypothetical protein
MLLFEYTILKEAQKHVKHPFGSKVSRTILTNCLNLGYIVKNSKDEWEITDLGLSEMHKLEEERGLVNRL